MLLHHLFKELVLIEVATSPDIWPIADRALHRGFPWFSLMRKHSLPANSWSFLPDGLWNAVLCCERRGSSSKGTRFCQSTLHTDFWGMWKPLETCGHPRFPKSPTSSQVWCLETEVLSTKKGANLSSPTVNFPKNKVTSGGLQGGSQAGWTYVWGSYRFWNCREDHVGFSHALDPCPLFGTSSPEGLFCWYLPLWLWSLLEEFCLIPFFGTSFCLDTQWYTWTKLNKTEQSFPNVV